MRFKWERTYEGCIEGEKHNYEAKLSDKTSMHITRTFDRHGDDCWNVHFEPDKTMKPSAMQYVGTYYGIAGAKREARKWWNENGCVL